MGPATAKWDYFTAEGQLIGCVYRYDPPGRRKEFRPWDAKRKKMAPPDPRPLYNQMDMATTDTVVLVEGEKCAQTLIDGGAGLTTAMHGAHAPIEKNRLPVPDRQGHVLIWPDRDKAGWDYAMAAADAVLMVGALSCAVLMPPEDKSEGWDVADGLAEDFDVQSFWRRGRASVSCHQRSEESGAHDENAVWATDDALALSFTRRYAEDWRCRAVGQVAGVDRQPLAGRRHPAGDSTVNAAFQSEAAIKADQWSPPLQLE